MRTKYLTLVKEDYLRAIFHLEEEDDGSLRIVDIARYLGLSKSTVSERLQELAAQKLISHPRYGALQLTRRGHTIAKKLTHKHRVVEVFLHKILGIPSDEVHEEAHKLEHALSDKVIKKLDAFLGHPKTDPHGTPIPTLL